MVHVGHGHPQILRSVFLQTHGFFHNSFFILRLDLIHGFFSSMLQIGTHEFGVCQMCSVKY
jgi:hypothetical protein